MYADSGLLGLARSRRRLRPDGFRGSFFADFATNSSWKTENSSWAWAATSDGATLSSSSRLFVLTGLSSSSFFLVNLDSFCFLSFFVGSESKWSISFSNLMSSLFVSLLVFVRLVEVWELLCFSQVLPALTDFFHDVERRQIRVAFWYQTSVFSKIVYEQNCSDKALTSRISCMQREPSSAGWSSAYLAVPHFRRACWTRWVLSEIVHGLLNNVNELSYLAVPFDRTSRVLLE